MGAAEEVTFSCVRALMLTRPGAVRRMRTRLSFMRSLMGDTRGFCGRGRAVARRCAPFSAVARRCPERSAARGRGAGRRSERPWTVVTERRAVVARPSP